MSAPEPKGPPGRDEPVWPVVRDTDDGGPKRTYGPQASAVMEQLDPSVQKLSNPSHPPRTSSEVEFVRLAHSFPTQPGLLASVDSLDLGEGVHGEGASPTTDSRDQAIPNTPDKEDRFTGAEPPDS